MRSIKLWDNDKCRRVCWYSTGETMLGFNWVASVPCVEFEGGATSSFQEVVTRSISDSVLKDLNLQILKWLNSFVMVVQSHQSVSGNEFCIYPFPMADELDFKLANLMVVSQGDDLKLFDGIEITPLENALTESGIARLKRLVDVSEWELVDLL